MGDNWPVWLFEYDYDGATYGFSIPARTADEARDRIKKLALYGRYCGELKATIAVPSVAAVPASWIARAWCWWKNRE
jgi:hypothetical protein